MLLVEPQILSVEEIHKYMKQFGVTYECAVFEMHKLIDEYKKQQEREFRKDLLRECFNGG